MTTQNRISSFIAVSSGKGGVGKSTTAVNLALALVQKGQKVGLLDADLYGPNIPTMLGVMDSPKVTEEGEKEMLIPPVAYGIKTMSMGFLAEPDQAMIWRGPILHNAIRQFLEQVQWGELDTLVIDLPPGTGDVQLSLSELAPLSGALMVTTPQEVSVQDVKKAFSMWEKVSVPVLGIVENMSYFQCDSCAKKHFLFGQGGGEKLSRKYGVPLLSQIPIVPELRSSGDEGSPLILQNPKSILTQTYLDLAQAVLDRVSFRDQVSKKGGVAVEIGRF